MAMHNDAPYVAKAVDSILDQTYDDFEFVIVNDLSSDGSRDIVERYSDVRIRIIDNAENLRLGRSLNRGVAAARGELVARLDANDIAPPDRLEKQVRFMREHPEIAVSGGQYKAIDTVGRRLPWAEFAKPVTELGMKWYLLFDSPFIHSAVMFRKSVFDELGGYNPRFDWAPGEDAELWARIAAAGYPMVNLPDVLVSLRHDPGSITYDPNRPHRAGFVERLSEFFEANMRRYLAVESATEWASMITSFFVDHAAPADATLQRYIETIEAMAQRFVEIHPEAARNVDVRRGKAQLLARAFVNPATRSRRSSARVFWRILRTDRLTARRQLPKVAAAALLGPRAWKLWRWWRGRRVARQ